MSLLDVHSHAGVDLSLYLTHGYPFSRSLGEAIAENRAHGVSHAVVFPMPTTLAYGLRNLAQGRPGRSRGPFRIPFEFENAQLLRQVHETFPEGRSMFIPFVFVDPVREVRAQVKGLEKLLGRHAFHGIKVMPRSAQARLAELGRTGRPLLEFAQAHDLPILAHCSVSHLDPWSKLRDLFDLARSHPKLRFCAAHFCGFHRRMFEEADRLGNVWVDAAAFTIGCELVRQKSAVYESGPSRIRGDYRRPPELFAEIAGRYPDTFMWASDSPFHTWISATRLPSGRLLHLELRSSMAEETALLAPLRGALRRKVAFGNALRFLEG